MSPNKTQKQASVAEKRAHYEALAEALITMTRLETQSIKSPLRVADELSGISDEPLLGNAIEAHFSALAHNLDWFDERTIRKFYVAMRLHDDELRAEREAAYKQAWAAQTSE